MQIAIANLKYVEPTNTLIDMDVTYDDGVVLPFTYHPDDQAPVSLAVRALLNGGAYSIASYAAPQPAKTASGSGSNVVA